MGKCFDCFTTVELIYRWFETYIASWINRSFNICARARCEWWCLCCNVWLCIVVLIVIALVALILWAAAEILVIALCTVISIFCVLCEIICFLGCFGISGCASTCVNSSCKLLKFKVDFDNIPPPRQDPDPEPEPPKPKPTGPTPTPTPGPVPVPDTQFTQQSLNSTLIGRYFQPSDFSRIALSAENIERAKSYLAACGCIEGKIAILVALSAYSTLALLNPGTITFHWGVAVVIFCLGALLGKVFGLMKAYIQLRRLINLKGA